MTHTFDSEVFFTDPDQLTLSESGGTNYANHIKAGTPGFSDFPGTMY